MDGTGYESVDPLTVPDALPAIQVQNAEGIIRSLYGEHIHRDALSRHEHIRELAKENRASGYDQPPLPLPVIELASQTNSAADSYKRARDQYELEFQRVHQRGELNEYGHQRHDRIDQRLNERYEDQMHTYQAYLEKELKLQVALAGGAGVHQPAGQAVRLLPRAQEQGPYRGAHAPGGSRRGR